MIWRWCAICSRPFRIYILKSSKSFLPLRVGECCFLFSVFQQQNNTLIMGKYYCCMADCSNFTGKIGRFGKTVTLHKLPSNPSLKRAWIIAISRKNRRATNNTRVCSDHFKNGIGPNYFDREKVPPEFLAHKPIDTTEKNSKKTTKRKNTQQHL